ncbi:MAG TPA: quercetin 2,3-dioxygenase [Solirubrobacteraceae bacterium]|nr:quercetin 2,3-dioxygenase [Solirubrobacteraceae bacterium]
MTETTTELPGQATPYVLGDGGGRAFLLIDQVGRCLAGAEETGGAMAMMTLEGPAGRPIPLHFHNQEHEFFYCHRGPIQLWLNDESRILQRGDFGYVPPKAIHAYGLHANHAGFLGPITPGGWERFFDLTGIPYDGAAPFPVGFRPEIPFAKFGQAEHDFDMKYLPEHEYAAPTADAPDDTLPASSEPYFLRAGEGPRFLFAGGLVTVLCGAAQTGGQISMLTLELPRGAGMPAHRHATAHEGIYVLEGSLRVTLDGAEHRLSTGDYVSIPAGVEHSWEGDAFFTKALLNSAPGGIEQLLERAGERTELHMFSRESPAPLSADGLRDAADGLDVTVD